MAVGDANEWEVAGSMVQSVVGNVDDCCDE